MNAATVALVFKLCLAHCLDYVSSYSPGPMDWNKLTKACAVSCQDAALHYGRVEEKP